MQTYEATESSRLVDVLLRLEHRLDRLETRLEPVLNLSDQLVPGFAAGVDTLDETLSRISDLDERLERIGRLLNTASEPAMLSRLEALAGQIETLPKLLATVGDVADEWMQRADRAGVNVGSLVESIDQLMTATLRLATDSEFRDMLDQSILRPESFIPLTALADGARASVESAKPLGLFGAMRAMGDPDVQLAVGFALETAKHVGRHLRNHLKAGKLNGAS